SCACSRDPGDKCGLAKSRPGRPRWVAMYLCRDIGGHQLSHIAEYFGIKRIGSISNTIAKLDARMEGDKKLARTVVRIKSGYDT
ncbi:MAG: hypothetical protein WBO18_10870, partial [Gammaproteobacteria bacterium]